MIKVRLATTEDEESVQKILKEADLHYSRETPDNFWVAEKNGKVLGIVRLEEHADFCFLTSLGVAAKQRKRGVATTLLKEILKQARKPIYLYTVIPDFFKRFGFKIAASFPQLPPKELFGCDECLPGQCVVMIR